MKFKVQLFLLFIIAVFIDEKLVAQQGAVVSIYYETNSYIITSNEMSKLKEFVSKLDPSAKISIRGYCDDIGTKSANEELSLKRATNLYNKLLDMNIIPSRIEQVKGYGEIALILVNGTDTLKQRAFNRKVELIANTTVKIENILSGQLKVGDKLTLKNVLFLSGMHKLLPESYPTLKKLIEELQEKQQYSILIEGHVSAPKGPDDVFDIETKKRNLSEARAKIVYDTLIANGVDPKRLAYKGLKANFPAPNGKSSMRVEIVITGVKK